MESDQIEIKDLAADEYKNLHELALSLIDSIFSKNDLQNFEVSENEARKENPETKYWLSTIVNKYSEKIEADQVILEKQLQELQTLQMNLLNFEEQNSFLRDMFQDAQGKMNQLQAFLDEAEANNEALQEKVLKFETKCNQLESLKDSAKKAPMRSVSLNSNMIANNLAANATKELQEEIENKKSQIKTLQETVALQEGLIEKLQVDVGRYIDLEDKYEQLKKDLGYLLSLKTLTDQIDPDKIKFDRKSISIQNELTSANGNSNLIEDKINPTDNSFASSTEGENLNLLVKGQSLSPNNSKSVRRQKSLAEDLRSTKNSEDLKGVSPFNMSRVLRPKPASQAQFNFKSNDFTTNNDTNGGASQNHKHTKTVSTFETDGFTPELRSPDNNVIESDIEDEFLDVFGNQRDLSDDGSHGRGKALMRWLDEADPKISEKDAESPISVKSRQTIDSVESQRYAETEAEKANNNNNLIATQDKLSPYFGTIDKKVVRPEIQISKKIDLGRSSEIALPNQRDMAKEISLYLNREKANAVKNTSFSVISLLKVLVFGIQHEQ